MPGGRGEREESERRRREARKPTHNHRPPPLILSERKLNIDQSKKCETMKGKEIEPSEQVYK